MKNKEQIFGEYNGHNIHHISNDNDIWMFNASDIAKIFDNDISAFLELQDTKDYISILLKKDYPDEYKLSLEDILLIVDGVYYLHHFMMHVYIRQFDYSFQFWFDDLFWDKREVSARLMLKNTH